jgi:hypothetical protein
MTKSHRSAGEAACDAGMWHRERRSTEEMKISETTGQGRMEETYISGSKGFVPNIRLPFTALCERSNFFRQVGFPRPKRCYDRQEIVGW